METSALRWPTTDNISIHGIQVRNTTSAYMEYKSETCKWIHRLVVLTCIGWHSLGFLGTLTQPGSAGYRAATATKQHYYMTWKTRIQKSKMLTSSFILPRKKANMWMSSSAQTILSDNQKWGTAQLVGHSTEKPGTILMWVRVPGAAKDFSPSQLSVQTLLQCPYSPHVQLHASTAVHTLKFPGSNMSYKHLWKWTMLQLGINSNSF